MGRVDPQFATPFVDVDEWRDEPEPHRYVHGGFEATDLRFSLYFPPAERYDGRFFQPILAVSGTEHAFGSGMLAGLGGSIPFAFDSGAYLVESNLGSFTPFPGSDPTLTGYRASAAVARHSRALAAEMYGDHRPYGYVYGGSGGGFKSTSCLETTDVWDGGVPFIIGSPVALPNVFSVQSHAMRILWNRFPQIIDAVEPGGTGHPYAGLTVEEREALAEVTRMGFPPRAWFDVERIAAGYTSVWTMLGDKVIEYDPTYFDDFWTVPGYLGASPTASLEAARVQHETTVVAPILAEEAESLGIGSGTAIFRTDAMADIPVALRLAEVPDAKLMGAMLSVTTGEAAGHNFWVISTHGDIVTTGQGEAHAAALAGIREGDEVVVDNSAYLAFQTYHRHQVHPDHRVWDQFCVAGQPVHPQRPELIGPRFALGGAGSVQSGRFGGKMIVVASLMDEAAYPWQASWYGDLVQRVQGSAADDRFRLWFVDHAMHLPPSVEPGDPRPVRTTRLVSYGGVLEQALRDVIAWVERGQEPPASTVHDVVDGQVVVPSRAAERKGVQPTVALTVDGRDRIEVAAGDEVTFSARVEVPPGTGTIVAVEWDYDGAGEYPERTFVDGSASHLQVTTTHVFDEPGTWFPAVRVTSHRSGDRKTAHARAQELGRVRVVVD